MTSDELAARIGAFVAACQSRVRGSGREQYESNGVQRFESMTPLELVQWAREEAQDLSNYAVMADIRLQVLEEKLRDLE